jgi:hypothetical protein
MKTAKDDVSMENFEKYKFECIVKTMMERSLEQKIVESVALGRTDKVVAKELHVYRPVWIVLISAVPLYGCVMCVTNVLEFFSYK